MSSFDERCDISNKTEKEINKTMDFLHDKLTELYHFRDHYFETHLLEDAINRNEDIDKELQKAIVLFDENKDCAIKQHRAKFYYLKGAALNVSPNFNQHAEELLSKAIKLDPKLIEAWNELGDCYCKNNNIKEATNCFTNALNLGRNKISLRNLSILARQEKASSKTAKVENIERGLTLAKEAVQIDANDGLSWAILGNAHLSSFFGISQNPKILKQCLSAYTQAEKDVIAKSSPDLHYNRAVMLKYQEEYKLALDSFEKAIQLDPIWELPKLKQKQLLKYLDDILDFVSTSGKMKAKRLQQILQSIDSKQLGPYNGGSYTSKTTGQTIKLQEVDINSLTAGINNEKVILGKVVCSVHNQDGVPFTFCLVDKIGSCVVATIYNIADSKGVIIGDSIAIPEPFVSDLDFNYNNKEYKFRLIRIETPIIMVVNGKKVNRDLQAGVQMSLFKKLD